MSRGIGRFAIVGLLLCFTIAKAALSATEPQADVMPAISIIIDDLGNQWDAGRRAINLPGAITYAFLPHLPYSPRLARQAHERKKEIMLHLPMESDSGKALGPGGLNECMTEKMFKAVMRKSIEAIPFVRGFNNHMGSRLTRSPLMMRWVMQTAMFRDDLYFVDSRTTSESVALDEAVKRSIDGTQRDIFLDYEKNTTTIQHQLDALIARAQRKGTALAIGHPYRETLAVLEAWLPKLEAMGVKLVPVSELIALRNKGRNSSWLLSSSR